MQPGVKRPSHATWFRPAIDAELEGLAHARVVSQRRAEIAGRVRLAGLVAEVDGDALIAERSRSRLEAPLALDSGRVGRRHLVHEVDIARFQIRQSHVVVDDDPEDDLVELRLPRIEVVRGLLDDDPILGDPLGELPWPTQTGAVPNSRRAC